jgi:hypothetical protein
MDNDARAAAVETFIL